MTPLQRRLQAYGRLEALNVVIVPVTILVIVYSLGGKISPALAAALAACICLLGVGALYWRAIGKRIEGHPLAFAQWIPRLARAEGLCLALILLACLLCLADFSFRPHAWRFQMRADFLVTTIAILEYLNYYRVQLQHFDSAADFRRLCMGKGFRQAHLRRDIRQWQRSLASARSTRQKFTDPSGRS